MVMRHQIPWLLLIVMLPFAPVGALGSVEVHIFLGNGCSFYVKC
jgi:hypothetical protein